ncbi:uncharacterized protein LOC118197171 isoform X2 [Stegodyphus dumicola]|uniref:uncharacterized protein LOC118197171 isoform X2 n=1 Tax=Stegodyphus dumicola TaxID=202533 RepID=UPI0015A8B9F1|nr:uncharacterized protein LOC118197171 isoform X2 [Stegodyphus dumicola]
MPSDANTVPDVVGCSSGQNDVLYAFEDKPREVRINSKGESLSSSSIGFSIGRSTYIQVYPPLALTEHFLCESSTNNGNSDTQMSSDTDTLSDVSSPESDIGEPLEKEHIVLSDCYRSDQDNESERFHFEVSVKQSSSQNDLLDPFDDETREITMPSFTNVLSDVSSTESDVDEVFDCSEAQSLLCGLPAQCSSNPDSLLYASDDEPGEAMVNSEDDTFSPSSIGFTIGKSTYIQIYPPLAPTEHFLHEPSTSNGEFRIELDSASDGSQTDEEFPTMNRDFLTSYCDDLSEDEFQLSPLPYPGEHFPSTSRSNMIIFPGFPDLNNAAANDVDENMFADYLNSRVDKQTARKRIKSLRTIAVSKSHIRKGIQCTVCLEDFHLRQKVKSLPCKHFYHKRCITPWLATNNTCPSCRKFVEILPKRQLVRSF